ncbi:MAG: hypothetical protein FJX78_01435 [Armatimonadetes bacterium]|nr:hypothetical protein [Armatimonadota bacterium]
MMLARLRDVVMAAALALIMTIGLLLWLAFVAPAQWVINGIAGAPARSMLQSPMTAALRVGDREWSFVNAPRGSAALEGTTPSGYVQRPVSMKGALGAVVLWLLSLAGL